ncbi:MAG: D-alanyl-D-alanine carboxypeptidase [Clostridia bacterium]|nr:D-alanyl-D-alanine carboxypeptidase [Clostridia bacterium]
MKKFISLILAAITVTCAFLPASAVYDAKKEKLTLYSDSYLLLSAENGEVIFSKNPGKQTPPASLTKIVTAIVVIENCTDLSSVVTVPQSAIDDLKGTGSSLGGIKGGEELTVYDLLCYMLLVSANDAANALADYVFGGDREKFIAKMNEVVVNLGCEDTHFVNPHGLNDDDQYTNAEDIATIMVYAMSLPSFSEIIGKTSYKVPETNLQKEKTIRNTNYLLNSAYPDYYSKYCKGGKTGSTADAGCCLVSYASNNGYNYVAVALDAPKKDFDEDGVDENGAFLDCKTMFAWTFKNIELVAIAEPDQVVAEVPVKYAKSTDYVTLSPAETVYSLVPIGTKAGSLLIEPIAETMPEVIKAPVKKGDVICKANVLYAGDVIKEIELVASSDIARNMPAYIASLAYDIASSWPFRIIAVILIILLVIFIINKRRRASRRSSDYQILSYNDFFKNK